MTKENTTAKIIMLIDPEVSRRLHILSAATGHTKSALVEAAMKMYSAGKMPPVAEPRLKRWEHKHRSYMIDAQAYRDMKVEISISGIPDWKVQAHITNHYVNEVYSCYKDLYEKPNSGMVVGQVKGTITRHKGKNDGK